MNSGFALPNVGPGPDLLTPADIDAKFAVLLLHRDFYCSECRQQIRRVKKRYEAFEARDAEVLSVLPEDRDTAEEWQKQYHLPFPVLADDDTELGDQFGQPTRFGLLGRLHDVIGRMPAVIVLDLRWRDPVETFAHRGDSRTDRPRVDELLDALDHAATLDAGQVAEQYEGIDRVAPRSEVSADAVPSDGSIDDGTAAESDAGESPVSESDVDESTTVESTADSTDDVSHPTDDAAGATTEGAPETTAADASGATTAETADSTAAETAEATTDEESSADEVETPSADEGAEVLERERPPKPQRPLDTPDGVALPESVELRRGSNDDVVAAMRVLQGALLDVDGSTVRDAAPDGEVLLAEAGDWIVGALVMRDGHIEGVAVRREYRGQGIGSALVEAAVADEGGTVTADFRAGVRGFWRDLGFDVDQEGGRFWGRRTVD